MNGMNEEMMNGEAVAEENEHIESIKQILASNDIEEIHQIAQGLLQGEQQELTPDRRSFADKMVEMHKASKEPEQEMGE